MPGDNCSIYGCPVSRMSKYKGTGIYKVPSGDAPPLTMEYTHLMIIQLKNITLSNLVHALHSYELCVGIKQDMSFLSSAYIDHVIPKIFLPSEERTFPSTQTKYLRAKSICSMCDTLEKKERKSAKRKSDNLSALAKLNAPIKFRYS